MRALLLEREPRDAKEADDRRAMLAFLDELPRPFSRDQPRAHFTASALVVDAPRGQTALVHHRKLAIWVQPGGHVDDGDASLGDAALREVREELGLAGVLASQAPLHLDIHEIPDRPDMPAHLHLDVRFLVEAAGDLALSDESIDARWLTLAEAQEMGDASVKRLVACLPSARATPPA
ncbi:MAG TPA: NUDIX domain-containing protein [Gaiellaceae bacterium]